MAVLFIFFHDDTWEEVKLGGENELYWKPTMQGIMVRQDGVKGNRTVYPWYSIRKYHVETEAGLRDQERRAEARAAARHQRDPELYPLRGGSVGGRGDVPEQADQGGRGPEGDAAERPE